MEEDEVVFEGDKARQYQEEDLASFSNKRHGSTMSKALIKTRIVNSSTGANYIFLIIIVVSFILSGVILWNSVGVGNQRTAGSVYVEDLSQEQRDALPPEILQVFPSRN